MTRVRVKPSRRPRLPNAAELAYRKLLRTALDQVQREIMRFLEPRLREDAKRLSSFRLVIDPDELDAIYGQTDRVNGAEVRKLIGIPSVVPKKLRDAFREENVKLITSIAEEQLDQLTEVLDVGFREGKRVETIRGEIEERFGVARSRADLIARDQVLKLNGQMTEARQTAAGIEEYVWSSSSDERVRPMHAELDGTRQRWDDPPETNDDGERNHPGGDYQCRCVAIPVLPWES